MRYLTNLFIQQTLNECLYLLSPVLSNADTTKSKKQNWTAVCASVRPWAFVPMASETYGGFEQK